MAKPVVEATIVGSKPNESKPVGPVATAAALPRPGGSTVWLTDADPLDLDPHTSASFASVNAWGDLTYQSLVMYDEHMSLVPALAEAWVNTSPTTWTFALRQGVRFHDGSEFEAEDVRYWFDRLMAPETAAPFKGWFSPIQKIEPRGKYDVDLTLSVPYAPLLSTFAALRGSAMAPRRWLQNAGAATKTTAVGSGPFTLLEYVPGSHLRYARHRDYWERGLPYLDQITLKIVPDEAARLDALRSGQATYAPLGAPAAQQAGTDKNLTVLASAGPWQQTTVFNTRRRPFDDVRVRQAVRLAVDRRAAIDRVLHGEGRPTGPLPTGLGAWAIPPDQLPYRRDVDRARELLAEAGHPDGFEATVRVRADEPTTAHTATVLADQLREIGVTLNVEPMAWETLTGAIRTGDFDLLAWREEPRPDPDGYLSRQATSGTGIGALGASSWSNAHYDEVVEQARTVMDPGARRQLYNEAAGILLEEAPVLWWFTENNIEAVHSSVKGYRQSFSGRRPGLKKVWLER